jgi:hypothetical protein
VSTKPGQVHAIKRGEAPEALVAALKDEEERKKALVIELDGSMGLDRVASLDSKRLKQALEARVADVKTLLGGDTHPRTVRCSESCWPGRSR